MCRVYAFNPMAIVIDNSFTSSDDLPAACVENNISLSNSKEVSRSPHNVSGQQLKPLDHNPCSRNTLYATVGLHALCARQPLFVISLCL